MNTRLFFANIINHETQISTKEQAIGTYDNCNFAESYREMAKLLIWQHLHIDPSLRVTINKLSEESSRLPLEHANDNKIKNSY